MTKQNIGIIYGGKSAEHSVSLWFSFKLNFLLTNVISIKSYTTYYITKFKK